MKFSLKIALASFFISTVSACIDIDTGTKVPTIGDQIIDLVKAKKLGVISEEEFKGLRKIALAKF